MALYTFDDDSGLARVTDQIGGRDGALSFGTVATVDGPSGCGRALSFADGQYFVVGNSPSWDLSVGVIDLWLWLPAELSNNIGLFSRDEADRGDAGHLSMFIDADGRAVVRVQRKSEADDNHSDAVSCSVAPLPRQRWVHLGLNFGPPSIELYVDGVLAVASGQHRVSDEWSCGQPGNYGIAGNDLPWVVGISALQSPRNLENLLYPAFGCAIDQFRISRTRRDFAKRL